MNIEENKDIVIDKLLKKDINKDSIISKLLKNDNRNTFIDLNILNNLINLNVIYSEIPLLDKCKLLKPKSIESLLLIKKISEFILEINTFIDNNPNFSFIIDSINIDELYKMIFFYQINLFFLFKNKFYYEY